MYLRSSIVATACLGFVAPWAAVAPIPDLSFDASNPGTTPNDVWDDEQGTRFHWNLDDSAQLVTVNDPSAPTISHAYSSPAAVGTSDTSANTAIYQGIPLENEEDVTFEFLILPPTARATRRSSKSAVPTAQRCICGHGAGISLASSLTPESFALQVNNDNESGLNGFRWFGGIGGETRHDPTALGRVWLENR